MRLVERLQHLVLGARQRPGADDIVDLRHVLGPAHGARQLRVLEQRGAAQHMAHRVPVPLGGGEDRDIAVGAAVGVVRRHGERGMPVAGAVGHAGVTVHHRTQRRGERDHRRLVHGDLDPLALAGALALHQRAQNAGAEMDARQEVADRRARLGRRPVGVAGGVGDAAHRLDGDVHGREVAIGSVEAEARAAAIDQARVDLAQHLPADAEAIHHAGRKILDQHVGLGDQCQEDLLAARLLEIEHHQLLVGVQHDQRIGLDLALAAAHDVALRRLDLEHARAHEAELQAGIGADVNCPRSSTSIPSSGRRMVTILLPPETQPDPIACRVKLL